MFCKIFRSPRIDDDNMVSQLRASDERRREQTHSSRSPSLSSEDDLSDMTFRSTIQRSNNEGPKAHADEIGHPLAVMYHKSQKHDLGLSSRSDIADIHGPAKLNTDLAGTSANHSIQKENSSFTTPHGKGADKPISRWVCLAFPSKKDTLRKILSTNQGFSRVRQLGSSNTNSQSTQAQEDDRKRKISEALRAAWARRTSEGRNGRYGGLPKASTILKQI